MDYVSTPEQTAVDGALALAKEISANGQYNATANYTLHSRVSLAPLALRAAKQAISRAPELSLESGMLDLSEPVVLYLTGAIQVLTLSALRMNLC